MPLWRTPRATQRGSSEMRMQSNFAFKREMPDWFLVKVPRQRSARRYHAPFLWLYPSDHVVDQAEGILPLGISPHGTGLRHGAHKAALHMDSCAGQDL